MLSVSSFIVSVASPSASVAAPDLMPFLPLAVMFIVPVPHSVTFEPSLHFMTEFSAFSFSGYSSSLFSAESLSALTEPSAAMIVTSVDLLHDIGAVSEPSSSRPFNISVTPVVPFLTSTLPPEHDPDREYVPELSIVR